VGALPSASIPVLRPAPSRMLPCVTRSSPYFMLYSDFRTQIANTFSRQKFYKLKKESEKLLAANGDDAATAPATPASTKATKATKSSTGKRTKAAAAADDAAADDDAAAAGTPTKKARTKKTTTAAKVKDEPEAEEGVKSESDGAASGGEANSNANENGTAESQAETADGADEKPT
jgi:hypothetical protein